MTEKRTTSTTFVLFKRLKSNLNRLTCASGPDGTNQVSRLHLLRLFLNKFIIPVVRIDYDTHSGKYQRATRYQVSVLVMCS